MLSRIQKSGAGGSESLFIRKTEVQREIPPKDLRQQGMESNATEKPVPREIDALLSDERLILRETQRAVTPFGGIAVFISFLEKIGFVKAIRQHMPIVWRSPNHIDPSFTFTAFLVSVLVGARRFAHASLLRGDRALHRCWD